VSSTPIWWAGAGSRAALARFHVQDAGVLINVGSLWGRIATRLVSPYIVSKTAVRALSECLLTDVEWAPPGGSPRAVPACAADAQAVADGVEPHMREVAVGGRSVPYWQAGPAFAPWAGGFFGAGLLPGLFVGSMLGGAFGGFGYPDSAYGGAEDPSGGGDFGDFGGGDFGGGFGGGDFGGGGDF